MEIELYKQLINDPVFLYDMMETMLGDKLGEGIHRKVFAHPLNDKVVVKIATDPRGTQANVTEFKYYEEVSWLTGDLSWVKDWFAPVEYISSNGGVLIMKRTEVRTNKKKPDEVPAFIQDAHEDNFGWIGNKFVCHDYGCQTFLTSQITKKMKKPYWV